MLDLFLTKNHPTSYAIKYWSKWDYIKRVTLRELTRITTYYHGRSKHVNNSHVLSNITKMLRPNIELNISDYFKFVDTSSEYIARRFDFVSNIWKGKVLDNIFYEDERVILTYVNTNFNIFNVATEWKQLSPIKLIYTNEYNLDYYQYDGTKRNDFTTYNVFEVDVNLMLLMYKYWSLEKIRNDESINPNYFIAQLILPSIFKASMDLILFNKFVNLYYGNIMKTELCASHPFHVIDLNIHINNILRDIIDKVKNNSMPIEQMLLTIPTICNKNTIDTLFINRPIYTRQCEWYIWYSRVKYICFILDILGEKGKRRNANIMNSLPAMIRMLRNRSTDMSTQLPPDMWVETEDYISKIERHLGRR